MELRSCVHLHFILAAKGGLATKALNVYHGRPALKFKKVKDLYETEDENSLEPFPVFRPKAEFQCGEAESVRVLTGERKIESDGETEISESNSKGIDVGAREIDDLTFGNMTLKQIKERCKEKRRKFSTYAGLSKESIETCSLVKGNNINSQSEEDEYDILEPLSCWKSRILNKKKANKKGRNKTVHPSSQTDLSIMEFEGIPSDEIIFQFSENFSSIDVKLEVPEFTCKDMIIFSSDSSFTCNELVAYNGVAPCEKPEAANGYYLDNGTSMVAIEEPDTAKGSVSQIGMSVIIGEELTTTACGVETQMPIFFSNEPWCCATNGESYEYMEHWDLKSIPDVKPSGREIMLEGIAEEINDKISDFSSSQAQKEDIIVDHPKNDSSESSSCEDHIPTLQPRSFHCVHEKSWNTSSSQIQMPDVTINNNLQRIELGKRSNSCFPENENKDGAKVIEASFISCNNRDYSSLWNQNFHSSPRSCLVSVADNSPTAEEKQSPSSACADPTTGCSPVINSCIDEPVISANLEDCHRPQMQDPPERLFSTRKVISPTSQKRLREAMESIELDDEQYYRYARKLCYRKQNEYKNSRLEGLSQLKRATVITSPKKVVGKPKICKNRFHQNDIRKVPHTSHSAQCFSSGRTSTRSSSESVILFSQQQMHDIESVVTKLAKELQLMKDIVEETSQSKVYPATSLKYSADEIRLAIQSATKVEESARRSLSIMARDCNRFCKLMKLAEKDSAASRDGFCKKRKIVFADEAGGKLCDFKTFEDGMAPFVEPKGKKTGSVD